MGGKNRNRQNYYGPGGNQQNIIRMNLLRENMARKERKNQRKAQNLEEGVLLSISILVSGREDTLEKCIASLDHLRAHVPCELILTDTGCSPELRARLEEKADKMLTFDWCNDFAAARNVGLQAACGKWFMFMDDDEWFEDTSGIEQFFLSGEYVWYESAYYVVRNYVDYEGSRWSDVSIVRMVHRREDTHFCYPIHEMLFPIYNPAKALKDYVHHYGYVPTDKELQRKKSERNLSLLLPALEKDPSCVHYWLQTAGEYAFWERWEEGIDAAEKGLLHYDPDRKDNSNFVQGLYGAVVQMRVRQAFQCEDRSRAEETYGQTVKRGWELLSAGCLNHLAAICICGDMAIACGALDKEEDCVEFARKYLDGKAYFADHFEEYTAQQTLFVNNAFELYRYLRVLCWMLHVCLVKNRWEEAEEILGRENLEWWALMLTVWYKEASEDQRAQWSQALERMAVEHGQSRTAQLFENLVKRGQEVEASMQAENPADAGGAVKNGVPRQAAVTPTPEMEALAIQLKEKIKQLMGQGMWKEALSTVLQLQNFFPEDAELAQWRQELERA